MHRYLYIDAGRFCHLRQRFIHNIARYSALWTDKRQIWLAVSCRSVKKRFYLSIF